MEGILMVIILLAGLVFGIPVMWTMFGASVIALLVDGGIPLIVIAQRVYAGINQYVLLAVPAFIIAGDFMVRGGLAKRIVKFSECLVGWITGGLGLVSIVACTFFAALSGSSVATTAAVGSIMIPEMDKRGYPRDFSATIQAIGGVLGIVIPPSIAMVVYGSTTGTSVAKLLISGIIPGLIACVGLCILVYLFSKKRNFPKSEIITTKEFLKITFDAIPALLCPVFILGSIYAGIATPTESAVVALFYSLFVALFVYKEMKPSEIYKVVGDSILSTVTLLMLISFASFFSYMLTRYGVPGALAGWFLQVVNSKAMFIVITIVVLTITGMFVDSGSSILIIGTMFAPIATHFGIDPVHYGLLFVYVCAVGQATPPFGVCLFTANSMFDVSMTDLSKNAIPYLIVLILLAFLYAFVPEISMYLPSNL